MAKDGTGWSDETGGPEGLWALVVAGLGLSTVVALRVRASYWNALARMKADPRWSQIKSREDADALVKEYL